jgi:hypothetical protein
MHPKKRRRRPKRTPFMINWTACIRRLPHMILKLSWGDMNAKVGKDMRDHNIGRYSLHEVSNGNGMRLIDFAVNRNMVISSVRFPHKDIHKETWITPNGHTKNQIDHVLIDVQHASDIIDVKSCRGADCDSDHYLVKIKYRPRLSTASRSIGTRNVKFNMDRIKD